jgi:hypothetical protein
VSDVQSTNPALIRAYFDQREMSRAPAHACICEGDANGWTNKESFPVQYLGFEVVAEIEDSSSDTLISMVYWASPRQLQEQARRASTQSAPHRSCQQFAPS